MEELSFIFGMIGMSLGVTGFIFGSTNKNYFIAFLLIFLTGCGGGGGSSSGSPPILNTAPQLTGFIDFAIDENTSEVVTFQAIDAEGDSITYSITGVDADVLSVDSASGELIFISPPNFENPQDNNTDNIYEVAVIASDGQLSSSLEIIITVNDVVEGLGGLNMLLMGNSFFKPYASRINEVAIDAGFLDHTDTVIFRGGDNGTPIGLWNNENTNSLIKEILDRGEIEILGMTAAYNPDNPTEGFIEWINHALQNNPNLTIFISITPADFPADWQQRAEDAGFETIEELYEEFENDYNHKTLIDALRIEFPSTIFFTIPTGQATFKLKQMYDDEMLLDDVSLFGSFESALFTDNKGHQGEIIVTTGALIWLNAIYDVHLETNEFDTGFNTDLHTVAETIMENHDPAYKQ